MMKNKEMRKENVLLWPLFCAYFFCFRFCRKTHAWIPRKYDVLSNCFKIKQLQLSLEEKSTFFAAPEVMMGFSAAWCLSIVLLRYIRTQSTQYNFASLRIVEGSAGAVVAASEIKAVELDLFSTSNCFSSCFLHAPVGDPFYERYNPFNNYGSTEWNWRDPDRESREFCGSLWIIAHWQGMKEQRNYVLQMLGELWF